MDDAMVSPQRGLSVKPMHRCRVISYIVGHFFNDMCAACWFSYLLVYLQSVVGLGSTEAGIVLFSGQACDAVGTLSVGLLSDKTTGCPSIGLGKRKSWYLPGLVLVAVSPTVLVVYFSISAGLFNVGWAAVQVAHMALIPDLTPVAKEQVLLNSGRYCFTVLANLSVFAVFYVLLHFMGTKGSFGEHGFKFKELAYFVLGSGLLASSIFLVGTKEPPAPPSEQKPGGSDEDSGNDLQQSLLDVCTTPSSVMSCQRKRPTDWLKERLFYSVGVVYMCTRLVVNQSQVYIPFYVLRSTSLAVDKVALVPFIVYLSSLVSTYVSKELNQRLGRRPTYFMGTVCVTCGCVCLWFGNDVSALVYVGVILVGWGNSAVMVTSVALEADLIGRNVECGAFVFGALSLTDKLSNGIGVLVIQYMSKMADLSLFYRAVVSFVPAVFVVLAFSVVSLTRMPEILQKSHSVADATSTVDTEARAGLWNSVRTDSLTTENSSVAQTHLRNMSVGQKRDSSAAMTGPTTC